MQSLSRGSAVHRVAMCTDDRKVAIGLQNGGLKVVDCCTGETLFEDSEAHSDNVSCIAFSADGRRLATGGWDETIRVWDTETVGNDWLTC